MSRLRILLAAILCVSLLTFVGCGEDGNTEGNAENGTITEESTDMNDDVNNDNAEDGKNNDGSVMKDLEDGAEDAQCDEHAAHPYVFIGKHGFIHGDDLGLHEAEDRGLRAVGEDDIIIGIGRFGEACDLVKRAAHGLHDCKHGSKCGILALAGEDTADGRLGNTAHFCNLGCREFFLCFQGSEAFGYHGCMSFLSYMRGKIAGMTAGY